MPYVVAIDPSINSLGLAFMYQKEYPDAPIKLMHYMTLTAPDSEKKLTDSQRITAGLFRVQEALKEHLPSSWKLNSECYSVIERPQSWGSYKSVASTQSGSLLILHLVVGALFWEMNVHHVSRTFLVPVSVWKGQLKKIDTIRRMKRKYHVEFQSDDESDAVGLGDWFLTEGFKNCKLKY